MAIDTHSHFAPSEARRAAPRPHPPRLHQGGLGAAGVAGLVLPGTATYAAAEAANDLVVTDYRLTPPGWR